MESCRSKLSNKTQDITGNVRSTSAPVSDLRTVHSNQDPDFISILFSRNLDHILERIFLSLPKSDIQNCKSVSSIWNQIILRFHESRNPRIQRFLDFRIAQEWSKKKPVWKTGNLTPDILDAPRLTCFVSDDNHIAMMANLDLKIFILDSKTLQLSQILDVKDENGGLVGALVVKLALDEHYLVAAVYERLSNCYYLIWNRGSNFSRNPLKIKTSFLYNLNMDCHQVEMHCLENGKLTVLNEVKKFEDSRTSTTIFEEWDIAQKTKHQYDRFHQRSEAGKSYFVTSKEFQFSCRNVQVSISFNILKLIQKS